jgi:hypothetical protein
MEYVKEHIGDIFNKDNLILMNEIKRLLDTDDLYYGIAINILIKKHCDMLAQKTGGDLKKESFKKLSEFWNSYQKLFGPSENIPISQDPSIKSRRSH